MKKNKFLDSFKTKTDSQLVHILNNKEKYTELAISASLQILTERKYDSFEILKIEDEIIEYRQKETLSKALEEEKKKEYATNDLNAPEIYSKKLIYSFSILFSTIFGAILLMNNLKETNNNKGRNKVLIFGIIYTIATIITLNLINTTSSISFLFNGIGGFILNEHFWDKFIGKELKHRKKSWIKPTIISILIITPFFLAIIYSK